MITRISIFLTVLAAALAASMCGCAAQSKTSTAQPASKSELQVLTSFKGGGEGGLDYVTVDPAARRVYVGRSTRVMVFDADNGTLLGEVADTSGVHGVAIVGERGEGFASCGRDGSLAVFDPKTFKITRTVKAGQNPDAILYDPATKKIFAFNGASGDITVVDTTAPDAAPSTLAVGGKLEFGATDGRGRVYVNDEDTSELVAIDSRKLEIVARWPLAPGESPTGLAIDPEHGRLFVGCRNSKMIIIDARDGKVVASLAVGSGVDGVAFDAYLGVAVTSNGREGTLSVVREGPAGQFAVTQTLTTVKGARTVAADPKTHRFYLPCMLPSDQATGTFGLLVVGMQR